MFQHRSPHWLFHWLFHTEAMNQSGQPRNSWKRGPVWPSPLTSGGLPLEEVTCRGWGPHLQYSFLIKLASLSVNFFLFKDVELKSPETPHLRELGHMPWHPTPKMQESRYFMPQPHPTMWLRQGPGCRRPSNP